METHPEDHGWRHSLALGALGVVYGDIGTSPIYTMNIVFDPETGIEPSAWHVMGVLSLIFWALLLVVTLKYMTFVLKADHEGDGGVIALATRLALADRRGRSRWLLLGIVASALLIGDSLLTPAISVLSAVQGIELVSPHIAPFAPPLAMLVLLALFSMQRRGTAKVGSLFGPIMVLWFLGIGAYGLRAVLDAPTVLRAVNPLYALEYLWHGGWPAFVILGSVFLVVTGSEALYADLGHFGRKPIRRGWLYLVWPCLLLNYFGQGALLLHHPTHPINTFFALAPDYLLVPLILFATLATVIASQAVITGSFSLFNQLSALNYFPRLRISYTSALQAGQIYVPTVNRLLLGGALLLVAVFQSSESLAGAYGVAIGGVSLVTSVLYLRLYRCALGHSRLKTLLLGIPLLTVDGAFFVALMSKLASGALLILLICGWILTVMLIWHWGQRQTLCRRRRMAPRVSQFLNDPAVEAAPRVDGTAIFLTKDPRVVPLSLYRNFQHNRILHRDIYLLAVEVEDRPRVPLEEKMRIDKLGRGFFSVRFRHGYMETPRYTTIESLLTQSGFPVSTEQLSIFASHARFEPTGGGLLKTLRGRLFAFLARNSQSRAAQLGIPEQQRIDIGLPFGI